MEIERKFLVKAMPEQLCSYPAHQIAQAYLCTDPVVRIRKQDDSYFLTYKSKGFLSREEYNLPLTEEAYLHLLKKADGIVISKRRYRIPLPSGLTAELDIFEGELAPLSLVEVEFGAEEAAHAFIPPEWFGEDVTYSAAYHNSALSQKAQIDFSSNQ